MGRARDLANILSSSGNVALDSELGLSLITPTSVTTTGGSATISSTGKVSFTGASTISLNDCFSSTYQNYRIIFNITSNTATTGFGLRMRVSGSDNSSSNYYYVALVGRQDSTTAAFTTIGSNGAQTTGSAPVRGENATSNSSGSIDIYNPFETGYTSWVGLGSQPNSTNGMWMQQSFNTMTVTTSYTGFTLFPTDAGNATGFIRVYGYKN
jgi:hypothetical protein